MIDDSEGKQRRSAMLGTVSAGSGYAFWGLSVIFYKQLAGIPPFEVLAHRSIWSVVLLLGLILVTRRWSKLMALLRDRRKMMCLICTALLVGSNWFIFIYSIEANRVVDTSLGYFINPLMSVALGVVLLREKLSRGQVIAVCLALVSVTWLTIQMGSLPWISIFIAATFAAYGFIRKVIAVDPLEGLFVEVMVLLPLALAYLAWGVGDEGWHFAQGNWHQDIFLMLTGPVTTIPLILFNYGAQRIHLATLGLMQYFAPSLQFIIAVGIYGEPLSNDQLLSFGMIWMALAIFSTDVFFRERRLRKIIEASGLQT